MVTEASVGRVIRPAEHPVIGHQGRQNARQALQGVEELDRLESGNLPPTVTFCLHKPYMLVKNLDVTEGLVDGMVGTLLDIEHGADGTVNRAWLMRPPNVGVNVKAKVSCRLGVRRRLHGFPSIPDHDLCSEKQVPQARIGPETAVSFGTG
ncbi:hypothetical protein HPB48_017026 [Haemaphysalis longicornis]|uniref:DNA helicase n=1 Tax=Haemaphysalis longicornis TaxID=44386 RepID=A0A9J6GIG0_HAELO|nr:hypothetical protein HPB48_017026 [Haemaphysalis longicornis]